MLSHGLLPSDEQEFNKMCKSAVEALKAGAAKAGYPQKLVENVQNAQKAYGKALDEERRLRARLESLSTEKLRNREALEKAVFDMTKSFHKHQLFGNEVCTKMDMPRKSELWPPLTDGTEAPRIRIDNRGKHPTLHFQDRWGNVRPSWASAACIYRRKVGASDFELVECVARSPFVDDEPGLSGEYEYKARFMSSRLMNATPESETLRVRVKAAKAA